MIRPSQYTLPFALLALLAGCSSSNDTPGSPDASSDGTAPVSDGSTGDDAPSITTGDDSGALADGAGSVDAQPDAGPGDAAAGHVLAEFPANDAGAGWARVSPIANAPLVTLDAVLGAQSAGNDQWANLARDGAWIAFVTTRFNCQSGDCLAIAGGDGSNAALVEQADAGVEIVPDGRPAIASGGALIVYPSSDGPHAMDLYAITKTASGWGAPVLLTQTMTAQYAHDLALSYDGTKVVFDCGPTSYQGPATDICVSKTDGSGTSVLIAHAAGPGANAQNGTHHPDYAPDGTVVFEADWGGTERVWRFASPSTFTAVSPTNEDDDNSPCVLPDGRIASLWLGRPGNTSSLHELKVMNADGSNTVMVVTGLDIVDTGQSCGN